MPITGYSVDQYFSGNIPL